MSKLLEQINIRKTTKKLGDLVFINQSSITGNFPHKEIEYIDTASVTRNNFDRPQILNINKAPSRAKRLLKDGDTILSTVRPSLCHYGFVKNPKPNTVASTGFVILTPKNIDPFYLYSYLTQDSVTNTLSAIAEATTTTFPAFRPEILSEMEVEIPDLPTQNKIAGILSAYDAKIENNNLIIKNIEKMAQTIFDEWFVKFRFPGYEKVKFVDSEMGKIPEGWKVGKMSDIAKRLSVQKMYQEDMLLKKGSVPVYDQSLKGTIGFHDEGPSFNGSIDNPILIFGDHTCRTQIICEPFSLGPNTIPLGEKNGYSPLFTYFLTKNSIEQREYKRHWNELLNIKFVIPPIELANTFVSKTKSLVSEIVVLEKENMKLKLLRDQLLLKLI